MREYLCITLLLVMILTLLPGCGPSEASATQAAVPRPLSFVVVNNSGEAIQGIGLEGANIPMGFRNLESGDKSQLKNKNLKLPEKLTLHWNDARGRRKEGSVNIWGRLGASYSGPVTLTITSRGGVTLAGG